MTRPHLTHHLLRLRRGRDLAALQYPRLAPLHAALTTAADPAEVAGEQQALTAFRAVSWGRRTTGAAPSRRALWRPAVLSSVLSTVFATKLSTALAAGAVGLTGVTGAAYAGALPDTLQDVAHKTIKAPAAHDKSNGVGPDATGDAAWGLCQAFSKQGEHGNGDGNGDGKALGKTKDKPNERANERAGEKANNANEKAADKAASNGKENGKENSVAYRNLVRAAGGEDKVDAYCATIPRPSDEPMTDASDEPEGKASRDPADKTSPQDRTSGKPTASPAPTAPTS